MSGEREGEVVVLFLFFFIRSTTYRTFFCNIQKRYIKIFSFKYYI